MEEILMEDDCHHEETSNKIRSGFDCNICLDPVQDPVVTLCGHLYCWPCIYRWLHSRTISSSADEKPVCCRQCPVCKSEISQSALVPLFGRGQATSSRTFDSNSDVIPRRPSAPERILRRFPSPPPPPLPRRRYYAGTEGDMGLGLDLSGRVPIPVVGMLEEMVFAGGGFGNNAVVGGGRVRRQMMEADRSLSRVCFFLCCCAFMCILLF
ncbi:E3 ubiquitin-protein ligase RMA1 [Linum grandiflorum]